MLPPAHRLRASREIQSVYREGRSWAVPLLALNVRARPEGQRVAVTVGKKVGKAVVRNRVRRRLREAVRAQLSGWREGFDAVLVARGAAAEAPFAELAAAVAELARRARLPREPADGTGTLYTLPRSTSGNPGRRPAREDRAPRPDAVAGGPAEGGR